ncbi:hypothetical protein KKP04_12465 [Rhodomicrobium sp. Az07]|uniref:hypothetical protein n=1 Tax=Rhodomicrobium sp. Az07 TaxID=2839034 RepID=UPI001BED3345|nr:hypothetical protein [Rhodomicrobium sp. Az07]MBT3071676.1 hypothetical protein [Rhodomicrobium sp. Az07]
MNQDIKERGDAKMQISIVERHDAPGVWSVEVVDNEHEGAVYSAVFYGPDSEERAREYAAMKY